MEGESVGLCGGKRVGSRTHLDVPSISEEPVAVLPRDFFDDAQAYEMAQTTGNVWNQPSHNVGIDPVSSAVDDFRAFDAARGVTRIDHKL